MSDRGLTAFETVAVQIAGTNGLVRGDDGKLRPSPELLAEAAASEAERARLVADPEHQRRQDAARHAQAMAYLLDRGFPARACREATWNRVPRTIADSLREWSDSPRPDSLILDGPLRCGKTWSAVLAISRCHRHERDFVSAPYLLAMLRQGMRDEEVRQWRRTDLLLIDDLGAEEELPSWLCGLFFEFVDSRYRDGRVTVITTNALDQDAAAKAYGSRVAVRLHDPEVYRRIVWAGGARLRAAR